MNQPSQAKSWGLYVHIPTCRIRCPYCAFTVIPLAEMSNWGSFTQRLIEEYNAKKHNYPTPASTLYLGGGTPSLAPISTLEAICSTVETRPNAEVTLEVNPEDLNRDWLAQIQACGINRISLGIQSTDPAALKRLGRAHTTSHLEEAVQLLQQSSLNSWSVDLMFGLPEQNLSQVKTDLEVLLAFEPPHLSLYGLTIEEGTPFYDAYNAGKITPSADDTWRDMYDYLVDMLSSRGLERYEVSNFARPGHRSLHNQSYWQDAPYMGIGPGAHSYGIDGSRSSNHRDFRTYMSQTNPNETVELPLPEQAATDYLLSAMRSVEGASRSQLLRRTSFWPRAAVRQRLQSTGLLIEEADRIRLSTSGFPIADSIIAELVEGLEALS